MERTINRFRNMQQTLTKAVDEAAVTVRGMPIMEQMLSTLTLSDMYGNFSYTKTGNFSYTKTGNFSYARTGTFPMSRIHLPRLTFEVSIK